MVAQIFEREEFLKASGMTEERLSEWERDGVFRPAGYTEGKIPFYDQASVEELPKVQALFDFGYSSDEVRKIRKKVGLPEEKKSKNGKSNKFLSVGELADRTGVSIRTIKYWEEKGIIDSEVRSEGGFRLYPSGFVTVCKLIRGLQEFGLKLDEIRPFVEMFGTIVKLEKEPEAYTPEEIVKLAPEMTEKISAIEKKARSFKESAVEWENYAEGAKKKLASFRSHAEKVLRKKAKEAEESQELQISSTEPQKD
ncbi:MAG: MerR family transcriptional regulator [Planctomycetes bacterium]|nr:MerR family transcriptional regulator [Planctomycetota bacterium]